MTPSDRKALPSLDREKQVAVVKNKTLTWNNPNWHVMVDKDDEVYIYYLKDPELPRTQYQVFRGIWSRSKNLGDHLIPVDITGYLIPEGHQYSGAPVGAFIRTDLTITNKLPLLRSVQMYMGKRVCVEDLILGNRTSFAVISHNEMDIPFTETVDTRLLTPCDEEKDLGYNPCMSFGEVTEPENNQKGTIRAINCKIITEEKANFCSCSMQILMRSGCQCGGS